MKLALSTIAGVEALAKKEVEKLGIKILKVQDKLLNLEWNLEDIARLNVWSRVGNKVYVELASWICETFDELFDLVYSIDWKYYIRDLNPIVINAATSKSFLESEKTIQSIWKKAIIKKLSWDDFRQELENYPEISVLVLIVDNEVKVLLNTTWEALHKRGYRLEQNEAPIKESLAAALVQLANWNFRENFYDPFCGSGTIAIEAAMIARNIAPWIHRKFAFEKFAWYPKEIIENVIDEAEEKIIKDKKYNIYASDINPEAIEIAKANAKRAWVFDTIRFKVADVRNLSVFKKNEFEIQSINYKAWEEKPEEKEELTWTLVSNPPYGLRLEQDDIREIHEEINNIFKKNRSLKGWIITSFLEFENIIMKKFWKQRKLYNWRELCYFYSKVDENKLNSPRKDFGKKDFSKREFRK